MPQGLGFKDFIKKCHPDAKAKGSQKTQPRPQGVGVIPVSEDSKHLFPYFLINLFTFKKAAFTLAEVLITLAIIGIVAAMTIPTLIASYKEKQTVSQLTKTFQTLSNAYQMMQAEYGTINTWGLKTTHTGNIDEETGKPIYDHSAQKLVAERFKKYLKVAKTCEYDKVCNNFNYYNLSGEKLTDTGLITSEDADNREAFPEGMFFLNDGTFVVMATFFSGEGGLYVVLPGSKDATLGKTRFYFYFNSKGFFPRGMKGDQTMPFETLCKPGVGQGAYDGQGCTAWVIYNKNMDYLHCPDELSWDGKHKCD